MNEFRVKSMHTFHVKEVKSLISTRIRPRLLTDRQDLIPSIAKAKPEIRVMAKRTVSKRQR